MPNIDLTVLNHALDLLPNQFRGPGGVAGVVLDGRTVAQRAWGYADMVKRLPLTAQTRMPICSISKHMTCALLLSLFNPPNRLDVLLPDFLPNLTGPLPTIVQLCHNQSGLRDYWALTVLQGAMPEAVFTREQGLALLKQARSTHFTPGSSYSYSNGNFRLLAELIERVSGRDFGDLLEEYIFAPAGMSTAKLSPDTAQPLDGVIGYEGNDAMGFIPAGLGINWLGDAGVWASLDDMLAWEVHIDATRNDPNSLYNRISAPVTFADGKPALYGYGLRRDQFPNVELTGHGGALRGFSSYRLHVADRRLSIYVNFNHESGAIRAAMRLLEAALGEKIEPTPVAAQGWDGLWMDDAAGLFIRTRDTTNGVQLNYQHTAQILCPTDTGHAHLNGITLTREGDELAMQRPAENITVTGRPVNPLDLADGVEIAGEYYSDEIDASIQITSRDGATYVGFTGSLGAGPVERVYPLARDLWSVPTRRSMDAAPPGEWTLQVKRDEANRVVGLVIGCWLARNIGYRRV